MGRVGEPALRPQWLGFARCGNLPQTSHLQEKILQDSKFLEGVKKRKKNNQFSENLTKGGRYERYLQQPILLSCGDDF